jgi:serine protease AprX
MAGLVAGTRTGVAPGADIVSIKVAGDDGTTTLRTLIQAIGWAVVHQHDVGIDVLNLSLGTVSPMGGTGRPLAQAVEAAWACRPHRRGRVRQRGRGARSRAPGRA